MPSTIPPYTLAQDKAIALLAKGTWTVSYPGSTLVRIRHSATVKSYGLRWDDGTDLRKLGVAFVASGTPGIRGIDAYDTETGRHFASYRQEIDYS